MAETIIVDADIIIDYLKTGEGKLTKAYEEYKMVIVPTTYTEILASATFADEKLEADVKSFLSEYFDIKPMDEAIALHAAKIIRMKSDMALAHACVAATAAEGKMKLLTDRGTMYDGIDGVEVMTIE